MKSFRKRLTALDLTKNRSLAILAVVFAFSAFSYADSITFTQTGVGSGQIGATTFTNAAFTITDVGNTASRASFSNGFYIDDTTASISIQGVGTFTFTTGTRTFVNNADAIVGFSRAGSGGFDLFDGPTNSAFTIWDMLSSIGPIGGTGSLLQWTSPAVNTNGGVLTFKDGVSDTVFTATLGSRVPEPSEWMMFGAELLCLTGVIGWKRYSLKTI